MKTKKIFFLSLIFILVMSSSIFYPKYTSLGELVFKDSQLDKTKLIFLYLSSEATFKQTQDKDEITKLKNNLKSIKVKKTKKSNIEKISDYTCYFNICDNSGLLYQISMYDRYIKIIDSNKGNDVLFYLESKDSIDIEFLYEYFNSLENIN